VVSRRREPLREPFGATPVRVDRLVPLVENEHAAVELDQVHRRPTAGRITVHRDAAGIIRTEAMAHAAVRQLHGNGPGSRVHDIHGSVDRPGALMRLTRPAQSAWILQARGKHDLSSTAGDHIPGAETIAHGRGVAEPS
jgi:hypothetical protein